MLLEAADTGDRIFFLLPVRLERVGFLPNFGEFLLDHRQALARVWVIFFLQRLLFDFELRGSALQLVDIGRKRIDLDAQ